MCFFISPSLYVCSYKLLVSLLHDYKVVSIRSNFQIDFILLQEGICHILPLIDLGIIQSYILTQGRSYKTILKEIY